MEHFCPSYETAISPSYGTPGGSNHSYVATNSLLIGGTEFGVCCGVNDGWSPRGLI